MASFTANPPAVPELPALLDVRAVARLLDCSARHVYRLADSGRMPSSVHIGALVRWPRQTVLDWIAGGCKPCRIVQYTGRGKGPALGLNQAPSQGRIP
jgi:excisionase family DNA binding protein